MKGPRIAMLAAACALAGCAHVEPVSLPATPVAATYKGVAPDEATEPFSRPDWWSLYEDTELDLLQRRLVENSPDLASALARYQQASAATDTVRAARMPSVGATFDAARNRQSERRPLRGATSPDLYDSSTLALNLEYELDLWGRISQQVAAGEAQERAAEADLAAAQLALQVRLADTMIALRGADQDVSLLLRAQAGYTRALDMVAQRHQAGVASGLDVAQAQGQLEAASSQLHQVQAQRAVLEHAIAALVGEHPSTFSITPTTVAQTLPTIPAGLPSDLLLRRPDIAAARQRVSSAASGVGVARTAFFPSVRLGASVGYQSDDISDLIAAPNLMWAIGPSLLATVFDGGRRKAEIRRAEAVLDEAGQSYRQVVLAAFQQVEDQLSLINQYGQAGSAEQRATQAAQRALDLASSRYRDGAASYLDVVIAQANALQAQRRMLDLNNRQRRASVQLILALGGGWLQRDDALLASSAHE